MHIWNFLFQEVSTLETSMILASVIVMGFSSVCVACSVCMGNLESSMTKGMMAGIGVLLGITACVLVSFGCFFVCLARRSSRVTCQK